ncbi:pseudouridine synthase [Streptosporangium sp. NBC_01755]|uniref:pseudouridine synthase n=1 Tax=Streptosporangium sp. NBC_01755 TaxID=2975949 RepID=UPI002DDA551F|nr:pseudouridine synthase [Streptosporangium sp. NBC_01755]WSC99099.1 pseudouridine synthase [Streptosporangium sp. NBC_01755]
MNNSRSTPSGEGRGQGRGGAPRGGNPRGGSQSGGFRGGSTRGGSSRGGSSSGGSRGGSQGGFRSDGPRRDDRGGSQGGFRAERDGSRSSYDRPSGAFRSDGPRRDDRGGSPGGFRSDGPRRDDRGGPSSGGSRGGFRSDGPRRDDRGGSSFGGSRDGSRGSYGRPSGGSPGGFRSDGPRRDDRGGSPGGFRSDGPRRDDRGGSSFGGSRDGSRSRYGRPSEGSQGGYRSDAPRRDDRGGSSFGGARDGSRSDFRSDAPRRDDRGGFRADRDGSRGRPGSDRGRGGAPAGGSRGRFGRTGRRDDVQTIGGDRAGAYGERRASADRPTGRAPEAKAAKAPLRPGTIANDRFKTARQPKRDSDFYDRDYVDERDTTEVPDGVRLQKVLAQAGVASRRACEDMIGDGRVTVDGQVVRRFGARVDPAKQVIHVDGKRLPTMPDLVYLAINKPIGVVSTMSDPDGRPSLADFVADRTERLFHVGRLDTETEGLILLTNDGELANRLTHPSYGVQKKYWAKVPGRIERDLGRRLKKGVELEDGLAKADSFGLVQEHGQQALVEIVLHEGRKHIVRRMLEEVGHPVIDLARIEFGPVKLGRLKPGTVRALTLTEVGELYAAVGL